MAMRRWVLRRGEGIGGYRWGRVQVGGGVTTDVYSLLWPQLLRALKLLKVCA